jgi:hypothetical protein
MFFADNLKRTIYVCPRSVNDDGVSVFGEPIEYQVNCYNVLPTSASADLVTVGTSYLEYMQVLGDPEYLRSIKALDKAYVNVEPPTTADPLAKSADFFVKGVVPFPNVTRVLLKSLTVEGDSNV